MGPEYRFEWQAQRTKKDDKWGPYENLILWSHYGKDGKDGDGVQYIFTANTGNTPSLPDDYMDDPNYQNNEGEEYTPKGWDDDPIPVNETLTHCWVCIRRYRNGKWGPYTDPIIWDSYYVEGITQDMIVVDLAPELVMVNPDDPSCSTNVYAYQGKTPIAIKSISCTFDGGNASYNPVKHTTGEG